MRVLVLSIDGRGMGHLNRTLLLARALTSVAPLSRIRFLAESPACDLIRRAGFGALKLPDPMHGLGRYALVGRRAELEAEWMEPILAAWRPDGVVIDFVVDPGLYRVIKASGCRLLVVLRKLKPRAMTELASDPAARLVDGFVLPHEPDEFAPGELPSRLAQRCAFTGPLVRRLDPELVPGLRRRYGQGAERLLVCTLGGGGWAQAHELASCFRDSMVQVCQEVEGVAGVLVYGPLFDGEIPPDEEPVRSVRFEANLPELMAAADGVVCSAGYNSVRELLAAGSPGVLVPLSNPGRDDQAERAKGVQAEGRALVAGLRADAIADALLKLLSGEGPVARPLLVESDSRRAGDTLLRLLEGP